MTKREVGWTTFVLTVGVAVGALLYRHCATSSTSKQASPRDAEVAEDDPPADSQDAPVETVPVESARPSVPPAPAPDPDEPTPSEAVEDAATPLDAHSAAGGRLKLRNLRIHPLGNDHLCLSASEGSPVLELLPCRTHKTTERWTFVEDLSGTSVIRGHDGGCLRVGAVNRRGEPTLEVQPCGADTPRFRVTADHRIEETHSGQCLTAKTVDKHARIVLAVSDPNARALVQAWVLSP